MASRSDKGSIVGVGRAQQNEHVKKGWSMDFDEDNGEAVNHAMELAKELIEKAAYSQG